MFHWLLFLGALLPLPIQALRAVALSVTPASDASTPVLPSFVSFSIEFVYFPDYAGNSSAPNTFSYNLLSNLGHIQGSNPVIRVGGNTQDYPIYNASQSEATIGTFDFNKSSDYPTTITIGPSFFDSYSTWPNTTFIHGFNLGKNGTVGLDSLLATVPLACKALEGGKLAYWELGNEPDLYKTSAQGAVRPASWNELDYVDEWLGKTRTIRTVMAQSCPDLVQNSTYKYIAPSFAGTSNSLDPIITWQDGLDVDQDVALISSHKYSPASSYSASIQTNNIPDSYINGATSPGVTLQHTLMNHTSTVSSVAKQVNESSLLAKYNLPFILGETNSLYNEGAPGLSNAFGAALWGVDFNLYCASVGIGRVHMHQGTNYRYAAWQPVSTPNVTIGTKPPYYGSIAVASMMGDMTKANVSISSVPMASEFDAAYAAYVNDELARIAIINLVEYNYTTGGSRPSVVYNISVPSVYSGRIAGVQRLMANGSDAISGITWDGYSYNWELDEGRPVLQTNVTRLGAVQIGQGGELQVALPYSSMAMINLGGPD